MSLIFTVTIVFPLVLIPAYGVPLSLLIHSYSLIGLLRKTSQQPRRGELLHYGMDTGPRTNALPSPRSV